MIDYPQSDLLTYLLLGAMAWVIVKVQQWAQPYLRGINATVVAITNARLDRIVDS